MLNESDKTDLNVWALCFSNSLRTWNSSKSRWEKQVGDGFHRGFIDVGIYNYMEKELLINDILQDN